MQCPSARARRRWERLSTAQQLRLVLTVSMAALAVVVGLFAVGIVRSEGRVRHADEQRFLDRGRVGSALIESLLSSTFRTARMLNTRLYGTRRVSSHALDQAVRKGGLAFGLLFGPDGQLLAESSGAPRLVHHNAASYLSALMPVRAGAPFTIGGEETIAGAGLVVPSAEALDTRYGRRVFVAGAPVATWSGFLKDYMQRLSGSGAQAYIIDARGTVVASSSGGAVPGAELPPTLDSALANAERGRASSGSYFASNPIAGSSWRVLVTAPDGAVFTSLRGTPSWLPWSALALVSLIGLVAVVLIHRVMRTGTRLRESNVALRFGVTQLAESEERLRLLIDSAVDYAIYRVDVDGRIASWSDGAERLHGYTAAEAVGKELSLLYVADGAVSSGMKAELEHAAREGRNESEGWRQRRDGSRFWANAITVPLHNDDGSLGGFVRVTRDMTERKRAEEQLVHDALHDSLTGLPNRTLFADRLAQAIGHAERREGYRCAVLFLDLDRFKLINDSHTHDVGDEVLQAFAERLEACVRPGDTVARLGGDEFTILVDDVHSADEASAVAGRVQRALEEPLMMAERELSLTVSVGIAVSASGMTPAELMRNADIAMHHAKRRGRARAATFDDSMHSRVTRELEVENGLRAALTDRALRVVYQPIVELSTGQLRGFEALARWPDERSKIYPGEFIKVAEETGLIKSLGLQVLEEACARLAEWRDASLVEDETTISVNVSRHQLDDPMLFDIVRRVLSRHGLLPQVLCMEITETAMIGEPEHIQAALARFVRMGVGIHMDDFGMGYSSLAFLRRFSGNTIKIDRSYIASVHVDKSSEAVVRAILELTRSLGMLSVAEGVELPGQVEKLREMGCDYAQGFLFSKPLSAAAIEPLIRTWDPAGPLSAAAN